MLYAAGAWATRGFPISVGHYIVPYDDGSFWALVIGLFFLVYWPVAVAAAARDARDERIVMMRRQPSDQPLERTAGRSVELL